MSAFTEINVNDAVVCSEIEVGCRRGNNIGEYDKDGNATREYIYLKNQPIGLFTAQKQGELLQIHTDHLGTPRAVTDKTQKVLWRWEGDAFGNVEPQIQTIKLPLRHAGQYADDETGLFYNYHRYYDPSTGRYITSDPIGLAGGLNTYGYVGGDILLYTDFYGLKPWRFDGQGDLSVCSYYDEMYAKTNCKYYKSAGKICRGRNHGVNAIMILALTHSWQRGKTNDSQSTVLTKIRKSLVSYDQISRSLNKISECECNQGNLIDTYHNLAFKKAGISPRFYGGNLWFQSIFPNVVPFDGRRKSMYDPRHLIPPNENEGICSCGN